MQWKRIKKIFSLDSTSPLMHSHSSNPVPFFLDDHTVRVFFSARDIHHRSSVCYFDLDMQNLEIQYVTTKPIASFNTSMFYSHGISIGGIYLKLGGRRFLTFMGWHIPKNEHWMGYLGEMELSSDNQSVTIHSKPWIAPDDLFDPLSVSYADIVYENEIYYAFYGSTQTWDWGNSEMLHTIHLAISKDGDHWEKKGIVIPYLKDKIQAFSRPTLLKIKNIWHMWFSYRGGNGDKYKIGHAISLDLTTWQLDLDHASLFAEINNPWECEMVEYPYVFKYNEEIYMMYNGNDYGKTGIGLAKLIY
jgi:hypothetical protein